MDSAEFQVIRKIFEEAVARAPEVRGRFLEEACTGNAGRLHEVKHLLAAHDSSHDWIDGEAVQSIITATSVALKPGEKIGSYEILGLLGVGGMGEVYRAQDMSLPSRHVAIKTLP